MSDWDALLCHLILDGRVWCEFVFLFPSTGTVTAPPQLQIVTISWSAILQGLYAPAHNPQTNNGPQSLQSGLAGHESGQILWSSLPQLTHTCCFEMWQAAPRYFLPCIVRASWKEISQPCSRGTLTSQNCSNSNLKSNNTWCLTRKSITSSTACVDSHST